MTALNSFPAPFSDPIAKQPRPEYKGRTDPQAGLMSQPWIDYETARGKLMESVPSRLQTVYLTNYALNIAATDFTDASLTAGRYRINWNLRVTTLEAFSTVQVTFAWTDHGISRSKTGDLVDGGSTANYDTQHSRYIYSDSKAPITYAVAYTALGSLRYALDIELEELDA